VLSERKDVLSAVLFMLTLAAYVRYAGAPSIGRYFIVLMIFALGLMSKPMLVTVPFVFLLLDYWPLRRFDKVERFKPGSGIYSLAESKTELPVFWRRHRCWSFPGCLVWLQYGRRIRLPDHWSSCLLPGGSITH